MQRQNLINGVMIKCTNCTEKLNNVSLLHWSLLKKARRHNTLSQPRILLENGFSLFAIVILYLLANFNRLQCNKDNNWRPIYYNNSHRDVRWSRRVIDEAPERIIFGSCVNGQSLWVVSEKQEVTSASSLLVQLLPEDE